MCAFPRIHLFSKENQKTAYFFKALSYTGRLDILEYLENHGPTKVEDLLIVFPLSDATMSQHLKILRLANLVTFEEVYPFTYYQVNTAELRLACMAFHFFFTKFQLDSVSELTG